MAGIFICYRRTDAEGWAGRLSDALKAELGRVNIFRDIEDIPPGVEFDAYIDDAVGSCDVLIALIGPRWLTVTDKNGVRRLDDPSDFTRLEIATALKRNVRVIPALLGGAQMPETGSLPDDIKSLARRQAYELSDSRWADDCHKLVNVLRPIVKPAGRSQKVKVAIIALSILIVLVAAGYGIQSWNKYQARIAREEAAEKEKAEQAKLAAQKAAAEAERQAKLEKEKRERIAEPPKPSPAITSPAPPVKERQAPAESNWIPVLAVPTNGSVIRQPYAQPWRFKWDERRAPGRVQQYHLRVMGPGAIRPAVDQMVRDVEYIAQRKCSYVIDRLRLGWKWEVRALFQDGNWSSWSAPSTFDIAPFNKESFCQACGTATPMCQSP
jgi:type II secretory pathway pseudopilin PulG